MTEVVETFVAGGIWSVVMVLAGMLIYDRLHNKFIDEIMEEDDNANNS